MTTSKTTRANAASLEQRLTDAGGPVKLLRSAPLGPYTFPVIPPEYTNWRDEQRAWKEGVALLELSYHMAELHLRGPQALALLAHLGVNRFDPFAVKRAKQLVLAGHDGFLIGDVILFREEEEFFRLVGAPFASDWVQFHAETGDWQVEVERDDPLSIRSGDRDVYRVQLQGPLALQLMRDVTDNKLPEIGFFQVGEFKIAGRTVRALRHGMAGEPGFEIYGPWKEQPIIRAALDRAGEKYGMRKVGALAYATTAQESGWMPMPLPAIYHGAQMRAYRQWLTAFHLETVGSLGGSFLSHNIVDYYVDPVEVGYGPLIDFDRDFIGREALRSKFRNPTRKKVTLLWNKEDVADIQRTALFPTGVPTKYINTPYSMYATFESDAVLKGNGPAGVSQWSAYSSNARSFISLALVNIEHSEPGTELTMLWGEPDSARATVEKHEVREIRVTVAPAPLFEKVIKTGRVRG
jgi:glycine cleavage system aminomethyltransferase T